MSPRLDSHRHVPVAFGVNLANLPHVEVVVRSALAAAAEPGRLRFHILFDGDPGPAERLIAGWNISNIELRPMTWSWGKTDMSIYTEAALLRLNLPSVLPAVDRVIYLDADVVVRRDLAQLLAADLGGKPLGAVRDVGLHVMMRRDRARKISHTADYLRSVGFDPQRLRYFNSGVLLMDLERLRAIGAEARLADIWERQRHQFIYKDQCLINLAFGEDIAELDGRWNAMAATQTPEHWRNVPGAFRRMVRAQRRDPWIHHFSGFEKPWLKGGVPQEDAWWAAARRTSTAWRRPPTPPRPPARASIVARRVLRSGLALLLPGLRKASSRNK